MLGVRIGVVVCLFVCFLFACLLVCLFACLLLSVVVCCLLYVVVCSLLFAVIVCSLLVLLSFAFRVLTAASPFNKSYIHKQQQALLKNVVVRLLFACCFLFFCLNHCLFESLFVCFVCLFLVVVCCCSSLRLLFWFLLFLLVLLLFVCCFSFSSNVA